MLVPVVDVICEQMKVAESKRRTTRKYQLADIDGDIPFFELYCPTFASVVPAGLIAPKHMKKRNYGQTH